MARKMISIRCSDEEYEAYKDMCEENYISMSSFVVSAMLHYAYAEEEDEEEFLRAIDWKEPSHEFLSFRQSRVMRELMEALGFFDDELEDGF